MSRTVDDVLRDLRVTFAGRTRYEGMPTRDDELLVAEIDRLRAGFMLPLQMSNGCRTTGEPCHDKCGCQLEMQHWCRKAEEGR